MNGSWEEDQSRIAEPCVVQGQDGHFRARFPGEAGKPVQTVHFSGWNALGQTLGQEVARAFVELYAGRTKLGREVTRGNLNKLRSFVEERQIRSLLDLTVEDILAFKIFAERVPSTRKKDWSAAKGVIEHVFSQAGRSAPAMEPSPWARRPEEWSPPVVLSGHEEGGPDGREAKERGSKSSLASHHPRARLARNRVTAVEYNDHAGVSTLGVSPTIIETELGRTVFFPARGATPAHRQDFTDWCQFHPEIAREVMVATIDMKRQNSPKSVNTWRAHVRYLLSYLKGRSAAANLSSLTQLSSEHMLEFRAFIDRGSIASRSKIWRAATAVVAHACHAQSKPAPSFPANPWPGHAARTPAATEALTASEIGPILKACVAEMNATIAASDEPGYPGATLADLFPFAVVLAFWTLFNPETVAGLRCSDVRPDVLGRFALIGRKGRSPTDQVATFPSADGHPCAPKTVIDNVLTITRPLRHRLPPDKRDFLFVGRVRQLQRAKASVQAYPELNNSMISYLRDEFCEKYGLNSFTIQQIRETGAVIVNRLFGGDTKTAQMLLNHLQIATTDSYVRRDTRRIEAERIADQMEKRMRFVRSGGMRDVRDQHETPQSGATPGFVCADPFFPPASLDQEDGMCAAYGACPTCPLASVDRLSPISFAHVLRLRNQIRDSHQDPQMSPHRWTNVWRPRLRAIEETWLPMFPPEVWAEAAAQVRDVRNPPLPIISEL